MPDPKTAEHQREEDRRPIHYPGLVGHQNTWNECRVVDLSHHGAGIECSIPMDVGATFEIIIEAVNLRRASEVRWVMPYRSQYRMGIHFLSEED